MLQDIGVQLAKVSKTDGVGKGLVGKTPNAKPAPELHLQDPQDGGVNGLLQAGL